MGVTGLDHVQLAAPPGCEAQARRFFGEVLGLAEIEKPGSLRARGGAWFACGAQALHVGVQDDFRPATKAHAALVIASEADLERLAAALEAVGAPVRWDAELPGARRFYTADPFGNRLELLAPVERG